MEDPNSKDNPRRLVKITKKKEKRLIAKVKLGDTEASRELIELHQERLFAFVWRIVRNTDHAEDVCQETFLRAFSAIENFDTTYRFSTWLFTIGYRIAVNHIKQRSTRQGFDLSNLTISQEDNPPEKAIRSEQAEILQNLIWNEVDKLSTPQKAVMMMFYREDLSCQEISESLTIPVATVKSHLHRGRNLLRERLVRQGIDKNYLSALGA